MLGCVFFYNSKEDFKKKYALSYTEFLIIRKILYSGAPRNISTLSNGWQGGNFQMISSLCCTVKVSVDSYNDLNMNKF